MVVRTSCASGIPGGKEHHPLEEPSGGPVEDLARKGRTHLGVQVLKYQVSSQSHNYGSSYRNPR